MALEEILDLVKWQLDNGSFRFMPKHESHLRVLVAEIEKNQSREAAITTTCARIE